MIHLIHVTKTRLNVFLYLELARSYSCECNTDFGYILTFVRIDSRKEVIHPQLPLRMPCYDLTLIIDPAFVPHTGAFGHCQLSWFDGR